MPEEVESYPLDRVYRSPNDYKGDSKKASPQNASGLMSMIPSGLRDMLSDDEKNEFTTKQENVSQDKLRKNLQTNVSMVIKLKPKGLFKREKIS